MKITNRGIKACATVVLTVLIVNASVFVVPVKAETPESITTALGSSFKAVSNTFSDLQNMSETAWEVTYGALQTYNSEANNAGKIFANSVISKTSSLKKPNLAAVSISGVWNSVYCPTASFFGFSSACNQNETTTSENNVATSTPANIPITPPSETVSNSAPTQTPPTIITQTIEKPVYIQVPTGSGVTESYLNERLQELNNALSQKIYSISSQGSSNSSSIDSAFHAISLTNKIDSLTNVSLTNPTITGGSITNSSFSGSTGTFTGNILATTGTYTGSVNAPYFMASSTATSTLGNLNIIGNLYRNGSPFVESQWTTSGSNIYYNSGNVGIGTTTPWAQFSVNPNGLTGPSFVIGSSTATNFIVTNGGNVGIGTTTPSQLLTVGNNNQFTVDSYGDITNDGDINVGGSVTSDWGFRLSDNSFSVSTFGDVNTTGLTSSTGITTENGKFFATSAGILSAADGDFYVDSSGNLGIGSTTPGTLISLGDTGVDTVNLSATATSTFGSGINIRSGCFSINDTCILGSQWTASSSDIYFNTGNVGIGTASPIAKLDVNGSINIASGSDVCISGGACLSTASDRRFKDNITNFDSALAKLSGLQAVTFNWNQLYAERNPLGMTSTPQYGFIAQEVEKIIPELVFTDKDGYKSVKYISFIPIILEAVKELNAKVDILIASIGKGIGDIKDLVINSITASVGSFGQVRVEKGIEMKDSETGNIYCVKIVNGEFTKTKGVCDSFSTQTNTSTTTPSSLTDNDQQLTTDITPPVITLNGNNPARVLKGATYIDLGVTVTDNTDNNPRLDILGDQINTTLTGTSTVTYVAKDFSGNIATSTREVVVYEDTPVVITPSPDPIIISPVSTTTATTTGQ